MRKNVVYGTVIAAGVLLVAASWKAFGPEPDDNFPDGTLWVCTDPACGNHFQLSIKELAARQKGHFGEPMSCPKCGKVAVRADKCQHCGKYFPQQREFSVCPFCGKPNTPPPED